MGYNLKLEVIFISDDLGHLCIAYFWPIQLPATNSYYEYKM